MGPNTRTIDLESLLHNTSVEQRFAKKIVRTADHCWIWTGATNGVGYGLMFVTTDAMRTPIYAHRMAFLFAYRRSPEGWILHLCDNRRCCNPDHLVEGDAKLNSDHARQRSTNRGRLPLWRVNAIRTDYPSRTVAQLAKTHGIAPRRVEQILANECFFDAAYEPVMA